MWIILALVGTCLLGVGALVGFGYLIEASEKNIEMPTHVREALLTKEDVEKWAETSEPFKGTETVEMTVGIGKVRTATYEFDGDDLYLSCVIEFGGRKDWKVDSTDFNLSKLAVQRNAASTDKLVYKEAPGFFAWGDRSWFCHIFNSAGERVGFHLVALQYDRLVNFAAVGVGAETPSELHDLLDPSLAIVSSMPSE